MKLSQTQKLTGQLADTPTRRQTYSPTNQLAEIDIWTFRHTDVSFRLVDVAAIVSVLSSGSVSSVDPLKLETV